MKTAALISLFACACATGTVSTGTPVGDSGIIFKGDASPATHDDGGTATCSGAKTLCDGACVNTSTDSNNCGACDVACDTTQTCSGGQCVTAQTSNVPPEGQCSHSLCTKGAALEEGCDPAECSVVICDFAYLGDDYCCDTSWDAQCIEEVDEYCQPYSCD